MRRKVLQTAANGKLFLMRTFCVRGLRIENSARVGGFQLRGRDNVIIYFLTRAPDAPLGTGLQEDALARGNNNINDRMALVTVKINAQ